MEISTTSLVPAQNRLIQSLPRRQRADILDRCTAVDLHYGNELCDPLHPLQQIYFPTTAIISIVAGVDGHHPMELGMIGRDGVLGANLAFGFDIEPLQALIRRSGTALKMSAAQIRHARDVCPALLPTLNRYLYALIAQFAQTAACGRFHRVESRLARCLLMTSDRAPPGPLLLTHQVLAKMLGVRRSAITIAAGGLQKHGFIHYRRGRVTILDRAGLQTAACSCYPTAGDDGGLDAGFVKR
jgi:CRP-like cAMP-binding protein